MSEHLQGQSEHDLTFLNRLEKLRLKTGATWADLGEMVGLSRTMLHHIRKGEKKPSQRTLAHLEEAEVKAGLRKTSEERPGTLQLLNSLPTDLKIETSDHDSGVVKVNVEFRRGATPEGMESVIEVKAPNATVAAKLLSNFRNETADDFLKECMPPRYATDDFLNLLEPASFLRLLQAAIEMSLGANWRDRLEKMGVI